MNSPRQSNRKRSPRKDPKKKVLLADDHSLVRESFALAINEEPDLVVSGFAGTIEETLESMARETPDIVLVDLSLGPEDGLDLIREIGDGSSQVPVLVVTMHDESTHALRAMRAGARGYVMKKDTIENLIEGIRTLLRGETFFSDTVKNDVIRSMISDSQSDLPDVEKRLTRRELEIFEQMAAGQTGREIAATLHISVRTVEAHRQRMKKKFNLENVVHLQHKAFAWAKTKELR